MQHQTCNFISLFQCIYFKMGCFVLIINAPDNLFKTFNNFFLGKFFIFVIMWLHTAHITLSILFSLDSYTFLKYGHQPYSFRIFVSGIESDFQLIQHKISNKLQRLFSLSLSSMDSRLPNVCSKKIFGIDKFTNCMHVAGDNGIHQRFSVYHFTYY